MLNSSGVNQFQSIVKKVSLYDISHGKISFQTKLLHGFSWLYADNLADFGRKLDKGVEIFGHLSNDASEIPGFYRGIGRLNSKFDSFLINLYLDLYLINNKWMKDHFMK